MRPILILILGLGLYVIAVLIPEPALDKPALPLYPVYANYAETIMVSNKFVRITNTLLGSPPARVGTNVLQVINSSRVINWALRPDNTLVKIDSAGNIEPILWPSRYVVTTNYLKYR